MCRTSARSSSGTASLNPGHALDHRRSAGLNRRGSAQSDRHCRGHRAGLAWQVSPQWFAGRTARFREEQRVKLARDTWLIFQRQMLLLFRSRTWIIFALAQPVTYLLLFAPMLKLALSADGVTTYTQAYRIYVPGLLTLTAVLGGVFTRFTLLADLRAGRLGRAALPPRSRPARILVRALRE